MRTWSLLPLGASVALMSCGEATGDGPAAKAAQPSRPVAAAPAHPVAVELFTSQGCSSCPPADAVLAELARQGDVVAISRPVTYWDRLGWKDTLAMPANTDLQRSYAARGLAGNNGVYTPQAVVQGQTGVVGGDEAKLRGEIVRLATTPEPSLSIVRTADGGRTVQLAGNARGATVRVLALRGSATVRIGNGENGGRAVTYSNVLVAERELGKWSGGARSFAVPATALKVGGADRYALVVREGAEGRILAARYL